MTNIFLNKIAQLSDGSKDALNVGTIAGIGGLTGMAANMVMKKYHVPFVGAKAFGISAGLGLAGDVAAVKINKKINNNGLQDKPVMNKTASESPNRYLEKIAGTYAKVSAEIARHQND